MNEDDFKDWLLRHDWYYEMSEDSRVFRKGALEHSHLKSVASTDPRLDQLFQHALTAVRTGTSITPFPPKTGTRDQSETETQTKPQNTTSMKLVQEILALVVTMLLNPLLAKLDELADAYRSGSGAGSSGSATGTGAKATKGTATTKPAAPAKKLTIEDVKTEAKKLTDPALRAHAKDRFQKELGLASTNDAKEEQFEALVAIITEILEGKSKPAPAASDDL